MAKNRRGIIRSNQFGFNAALSEGEFNPRPSRAKGAGIKIYGPDTEFTEPQTKAQRFPKKEGGQGVLWNAKHESPSVYMLGATEGSEHLVSPLLGVAARESLARWGELPSNVQHTAVSDDSHKLIKRLKKKGLIKGKPQPLKIDSLNTVRQGSVKDALRKRKEWHEDFMHISHLGEHEISQGSEFMRNIFRDRREKPKTDSNQTKFEGM